MVIGTEHTTMSAIMERQAFEAAAGCSLNLRPRETTGDHVSSADLDNLIEH